MTDLTQYVRDATRTESKIDAVVINKDLLMGTLQAFIAIGNILDMIKKNVFYGKEIDSVILSNLWFKAFDSISRIKSTNRSGPTEEILKGETNTRIFHALVGIATESTELLEALIKLIQGGELDSVNVCEELGDINWYQAIAIDTLEADFENILTINIDKLRARFPEMFTEKDAIDRDLETERQILEDGTI